MSQTRQRTESELAGAIIEHAKNGENKLDVETELEVPYNHYGDRGVVDLVVKEGRYKLNIYELKSAYALQDISGANEIIRQFKRHKAYFFNGSDYSKHPYHTVSFTLAFDACKPCINHIEENLELYKSVQDWSFQADINSEILVKHPEIRAVWPIVRDFERDVATHGEEQITEVLDYAV